MNFESCRSSKNIATEIANGRSLWFIVVDGLAVSMDSCHVDNVTLLIGEDFVAQGAREVGSSIATYSTVDFLHVLINHLDILTTQVTELEVIEVQN